MDALATQSPQPPVKGCPLQDVRHTERIPLPFFWIADPLPAETVANRVVPDQSGHAQGSATCWIFRRSGSGKGARVVSRHGAQTGRAGRVTRTVVGDRCEPNAL